MQWRHTSPMDCAMLCRSVCYVLQHCGAQVLLLLLLPPASAPLAPLASPPPPPPPHAHALRMAPNRPAAITLPARTFHRPHSTTLHRVHGAQAGIHVNAVDGLVLHLAAQLPQAGNPLSTNTKPTPLNASPHGVACAPYRPGANTLPHPPPTVTTW